MPQLIGTATPPVGINSFVPNGVRKEMKLRDIYRCTSVFIIADMAWIIFLVLCPGLVLPFV